VQKIMSQVWMTKAKKIINHIQDAQVATEPIIEMDDSQSGEAFDFGALCQCHLKVAKITQHILYKEHSWTGVGKVV
jgi:hypothetical protein